MTQLRQSQQALDDLHVSCCVVTFEAGHFAMAYVREIGLTWPLLVDTDRSLYRAYGMELGTWWNLSGPRVIWRYFQLFARGRRLRMPHGDVRQLGGDVVVDPKGIVRFHYVGVGPADRPSLSMILEQVRE